MIFFQQCSKTFICSTVSFVSHPGLVDRRESNIEAGAQFPQKLSLHLPMHRGLDGGHCLGKDCPFLVLRYKVHCTPKRRLALLMQVAVEDLGEKL